jgi:hypothetical protein
MRQALEKIKKSHKIQGYRFVQHEAGFKKNPKKSRKMQGYIFVPQHT